MIFGRRGVFWCVRGVRVSPAAVNVGLLFGKKGQERFHRLGLRLTAYPLHRVFVQYFYRAVGFAYKLLAHKQVKHAVADKGERQRAQLPRVARVISKSVQNRFPLVNKIKFHVVNADGIALFGARGAQRVDDAGICEHPLKILHGLEIIKIDRLHHVQQPFTLY